jgi:hypothetical protein
VIPTASAGEISDHACSPDASVDTQSGSRKSRGHGGGEFVVGIVILDAPFCFCVFPAVRILLEKRVGVLGGVGPGVAGFAGLGEDRDPVQFRFHARHQSLTRGYRIGFGDHDDDLVVHGQQHRITPGGGLPAQ